MVLAAEVEGVARRGGVARRRALLDGVRRERDPVLGEAPRGSAHGVDGGFRLEVGHERALAARAADAARVVGVRVLVAVRVEHDIRLVETHEAEGVIGRASVVAAARLAATLQGRVLEPAQVVHATARGVAQASDRWRDSRGATVAARSRLLRVLQAQRPGAREVQREPVRLRLGPVEEARALDALHDVAQAVVHVHQRVHQRGVGGVRVQVARPLGGRRQRRRRAGAALQVREHARPTRTR